MNEYEKFCIDEATFYMNKAHHILTEEMKDPKKYYDETFHTYRHLVQMFPYILAITLQNPETETESS